MVKLFKQIQNENLNDAFLNYRYLTYYNEPANNQKWFLELLITSWFSLADRVCSVFIFPLFSTELIACFWLKNCISNFKTTSPRSLILVVLETLIISHKFNQQMSLQTCNRFVHAQFFFSIAF